MSHLIYDWSLDETADNRSLYCLQVDDLAGVYEIRANGEDEWDGTTPLWDALSKREKGDRIHIAMTFLDGWAEGWQDALDDAMEEFDRQQASS